MRHSFIAKEIYQNKANKQRQQQKAFYIQHLSKDHHSKIINSHRIQIAQQ